MPPKTEKIVVTDNRSVQEIDGWLVGCVLKKAKGKLSEETAREYIKKARANKELIVKAFEEKIKETENDKAKMSLNRAKNIVKKYPYPIFSQKQFANVQFIGPGSLSIIGNVLTGGISMPDDQRKAIARELSRVWGIWIKDGGKFIDLGVRSIGDLTRLNESGDIQLSKIQLKGLEFVDSVMENNSLEELCGGNGILTTTFIPKKDSEIKKVMCFPPDVRTEDVVWPLPAKVLVVLKTKEPVSITQKIMKEFNPVLEDFFYPPFITEKKRSITGILVTNEKKKKGILVRVDFVNADNEGLGILYEKTGPSTLQDYIKRLAQKNYILDLNSLSLSKMDENAVMKPFATHSVEEIYALLK
jgi:hypothetical protein